MSAEQPQNEAPQAATQHEQQTAPGEPAAARPTTPLESKAPADRAPLRPRTGPMIWGVIVLAICAYLGAQLIAPGAVDSTVFLVVGLIGLGLLLLAVGIAVIIRGSRKP